MTIEPLGKKSERRAEILRGVYEDNRRVAGEPPRPFDASKPSRGQRVRRARARRRVSAIALLGVAVLVGLVGFAYQELQSEKASRPGRTSEVVAVAERGAAGQRGRTSGEDEGRTSEADEGARTSEADEPAEPVGPLNTPEAGLGALPVAFQPTLANLFHLQVRTIVIDPGHGGRDPGAVGAGGTLEKEVTLDVATRLKDRLERRYGYRILMTRETDVTRPLRQRVAFANEHGADLFISIHVNDLPDERVTSVETYFFGLGGEEAQRLAERENHGADYSLAEFRRMTQQVGTAIKLQESERLARAIQARMHHAVSEANPDVEDWGVRSAPFVVLLGVEAPSVLAEIAVLSNEGSEHDLRTGAYRERLASALENGIVDYLMRQAVTHQPTPSDSPN